VNCLTTQVISVRSGPRLIVRSRVEASGFALKGPIEVRRRPATSSTPRGLARRMTRR